MTDHERYLFDLQGYLTLPNALDANEVGALNEIVDAHIAGLPNQDWSMHRFLGLLGWGAPFRNLIDHPKCLPYMQETVSPKVRLDHTYLDIIRPNHVPGGQVLHTGGVMPQSYSVYQGGRFYNGLSAVAINLMDVNPGDGGFGCVPGSHKSNVSIPEEWMQLDEDPEPFVKRVTGPAGTVVIFTEALTHGTLPWTGSAERRTVFYKFSPHTFGWIQPYPDGQDIDGLTDQQRELLQPPSARYAPSPRDQEMQTGALHL